MPDQMITRGVAVGGVVPMTSQAGKPYWVVTDDQGQEWRCFDAQTAMQANQLQGQLAMMKVAISPAKDPQFGMNYYLRAIGPAPEGATPTGPQPLMQPMQMQQPGGQQMMPTQAPMPMPQGNMAMGPMPPMGGGMSAPQLPQELQPPKVQKTLGQGGNLSDADITRMARSTAIEAVIGTAFRYEDFRDEELGVDWERIYAVAEAATKFILFRRHEGWSPGEEIMPSNNDKQVLAQVHANFPGTTEQNVSDPDEDDTAWE